MQEKHDNHNENAPRGEDFISPEKAPRITGIEFPFKFIKDELTKIIDGKKYWDGVEEFVLSVKKINDVQLYFKEKFVENTVVSDDIAQSRLDSKQPILFKDDFLIFSADFPEIVIRIFSVMGPDKDKTLSYIKGKGDNLLVAFIEDTESLLNEFSQSAEIDEFHVLYALNSSYQVLVVPAALKLREQFEESHWAEGYCPMCGSAPEMGRILEKEGHYYLCCSLCFTEWKFPRIGCPFCGCYDQNSISHFSVEEYPGYRVNVCKECKSFIKVSLEKELSRRHIPVIDGILTLELDSISIDEGFHHGRLFQDTNG